MMSIWCSIITNTLSCGFDQLIFGLQRFKFFKGLQVAFLFIAFFFYFYEMILDRAESEYSFKGIQSTLTVVMSGTVFFFQPATFKVTCKFDFTNYPFDKQSCPVVFTSRDGRIGDAPLTWPNVYGPKAITFLSDSFQIIPEVNPTNKSSRGYYAGGWKLLNAWNNTKYGYHGSLFS